MNTPIYQILLQRSTKIILLRVLLEYNLPFKKYPRFGTWSYLLSDQKQVTIFDAGPKFKSLFGQSSLPTHNSQKIINLLKKYFPHQPVKQILLSHYHFDHSQNAPDLQQQLQTIYQQPVPIRLHPADLQPKKHYLKVFKNSLEKIFLQAGYSSWQLGERLSNHEPISQTGFQVEFAPGHTSGNIVLINHQRKIIIGGWWLKKSQSTFVDKLNYYLINEDNHSLVHTRQKLLALHYNHYFHHPL